MMLSIEGFRLSRMESKDAMDAGKPANQWGLALNPRSAPVGSNDVFAADPETTKNERIPPDTILCTYMQQCCHPRVVSLLPEGPTAPIIHHVSALSDLSFHMPK